MNKQILEQYIALQSEIYNRDKRIRELEEKRAEIENMQSDIVTGSSTSFPYIQRHIRIEGATNSDAMLIVNQINNEIRSHRRIYRKLLRSTKQALDYINSVDDSLVRQAMQLRYIEGKQWNEIANAIGGGNSGNNIRMSVNRYLKKH